MIRSCAGLAACVATLLLYSCADISDDTADIDQGDVTVAAVPLQAALTSLLETPPPAGVNDLIVPNPNNVHYEVPTTGTVYHVDNKRTGSTADGSLANPFLELKDALRRADVQPGAVTIIMHAGTYREGVPAGERNTYAKDPQTSKGHGDYQIRQRHITIQPYHRDKVWLKGSDILTNWTRDGSRWRTSYSPAFCRHTGVTLDRICQNTDLQNAAYPMAGAQEMVFINDRPLRQVERRNQVVPGTFAVENNNLFVADNPTQARVEATVRDVALHVTGGGAHVTIRGLMFEHYSSEIYTGGAKMAAVVVGGDNATIENNTIAWSASRGLHVGGSNATVRDNVFAYNGYTGANFHRAHDLVLRQNWFLGNNIENLHDREGTTSSGAGVKVAHTRGLTVDRNLFEYNNATGFWCDLNCRNAYITNNITRHNSRHGLYYEVSWDGILASNTVADNKGSGIQVAGSRRVKVYNNTLVRNGGGSSSSRAAVNVYDVRRCNPTLNDHCRVADKDCDTATGRASPDHAELCQPWVARDIEIRNNIISESNASFALDVWDGKSRPGNGEPAWPVAQWVTAREMLSALDYNAYHATSSARPFAQWFAARPGITTPSSHGAWTQTYSDHLTFRNHESWRPSNQRRLWEPNGQWIVRADNPFFVGSHDFRLRADSPAIARGANLPADVGDAIGIGPRNNPDLGALVWPSATLASPEDNATVRGTQVRIALASVPLGMSEVQYVLSGQGLIDHAIGSCAHVGAGCETTWNTRLLRNGTYQLAPLARDFSGAVVRGPAVTIRIDNVQLAAPQPGAQLSGDRVVLATYAPDYGNFREVRYVISGSQVQTHRIGLTRDSAYGYYVHWNSRTVPDGTYFLEARVFNASGTEIERTAQVEVHVRNDMPATPRVLTPSAGTLVRGSQVQLTAEVPGSQANEVRYQLSGGGLTGHVLGTSTSAANAFAVSWGSKSIRNGNYQLVAVATLANGTTTVSPSVDVQVDNAQLVAPQPGAQLGGSQVVLATYSHDYASIREVRYVISGSQVQTHRIGLTRDSMFGYFVHWDSRSVPNGAYQLEARIFGDNGVEIERTARIDVTVRN